MRRYHIHVTSFATSADLPVLAINNPSTTARLVIRQIANVHPDSTTTATYRIERFAALATGGTAVAFEPSTLAPRIARRNSLDPVPLFGALVDAFVSPGSATFDEWFTITSRNGELSASHGFDNGGLIVQPGECVVLTLIGADSPTTSVHVELAEDDIVPDIVPATAAFVRLLGETFSGSGALLSTHWTVATQNGGTATKSTGELVVATNTTADGAVSVESVRIARFLTGAVHEFSAVLRLSAGAADNVRAWGVMTDQDGYGFKLNGATMGLFSRAGGVDTFVPEASWDVDAFIVGTDVRQWTIRYDLNRADFFVDGVLRHSLPVAAGGPRIGDHDLPARFENANSNGSTTNHELRVLGTAILRYGPPRSAPRYYHFDGTAQAVTLKSGAGTLGELLITKAGTGGSSILIYDGIDATGALIADINGDALSDLRFGLEFNVGLHVVASANSGKSTVIFD